MKLGFGNAFKESCKFVIIGSILLCSLSNKSNAQFTKVFPLKSNEIANQESKRIKPSISQRSFHITDTLTLPFFEDFASKLGYPDQKKWCDKQVWVNNSFAILPPNYQVATFDHLNQQGNPYTNLDKFSKVFADSLTSQPINLSFYYKGPTSYQYKTTDNIYLSFFYQAQGLGDIPETEDSLLLYFKNNQHQWKQVWAIAGSAVDSFKEIFIKIDAQEFLHQTFQFRWVNYTKATGNLNHWHIDYIRLEKNRNSTINDIQDVGIVAVESGLCKDYKNVPYSHFKSNLSTITGSGPKVLVRNLNQKYSVQTRFGLNIKNRFGKDIYTQPFGSSARNILPNSDSSESFAKLQFDTLSTANPSLQYKFQIAPQSNDETPDNYNSLTNNNTVEFTHEFLPWYAYDDGSAEGGFGLDYAYLGNIKGQFAMEFNTLTDDSLRGIAMYFTQTNADVSSRTFKLRIWNSLSPLGSSDNKDQLIYEITVDKPIYRDSVNLFNYFFFDSTLFLPKGKYYVGWLQNMPYVLNVGYDNNYRFNNIEQPNPHLFYNLLGSWEKADFSVKGTPMIRMLYGERVNYSFSTNKLEKFKVNVFPNPASNIIQIFPSHGIVSKTEIVDISGRVILSKLEGNVFDVSILKSGIYLARVTLTTGQISTSQFFKQ